jgi:hypothetical protein
MNQQNLSPKAAALAERMASRIIRRQSQLADYLNRKTQHWNKASKLSALLAFCLLFGGLCLYFILKSIF